MSWFHAKDGKQEGPVDLPALQGMFKRGEIAPGTLVWRDGMPDWLPVEQVGEVTGKGSGDRATVPPASPVPVPAPPDPSLLPPQQNNSALTSMILGICSLPLIFLCFTGAIAGITAIVLGHLARKQIRESPVPQTGDGMALTGLILGYFTVAICLLYICFLAVMIAVASYSP